MSGGGPGGARCLPSSMDVLRLSISYAILEDEDAAKDGPTVGGVSSGAGNDLLLVRSRSRSRSRSGNLAADGDIGIGGALLIPAAISRGGTPGGEWGTG